MDDISEHRRNLAWLAGERAGRAGKPEDVCDRQRGTIYFDDWMDGHQAGAETRRNAAAMLAKDTPA